MRASASTCAAAVLLVLALLILALLVPVMFQRVPCCTPHSITSVGAAMAVLGAGAVAACNGDTFEGFIF